MFLGAFFAVSWSILCCFMAYSLRFLRALLFLSEFLAVSWSVLCCFLERSLLFLGAFFVVIWSFRLLEHSSLKDNSWSIVICFLEPSWLFLGAFFFNGVFAAVSWSFAVSKSLPCCFLKHHSCFRRILYCFLERSLLFLETIYGWLLLSAFVVRVRD